MKIGIRLPSIKKMIKARTTGKVKRKVKKAVIPGYGQKGMGILHPKKAIYNKVYNATTISAKDLVKEVTPKEEVYEEVGICPNCNKEVPVTSKKCPYCDCNFTAIEYDHGCIFCGAEMIENDYYCPKCNRANKCIMCDTPLSVTDKYCPNCGEEIK